MRYPLSPSKMRGADMKSVLRLDFSRARNDSAYLALQSNRQHEISKIIKNNEEKKLGLDEQTFSMDGCFEAQIVDSLHLNR